jgi:signal transduction histidine kinase
MYRADFQSIIFNLISNSIKAIIRRRNKMDPYKQSTYRNKIKISLDIKSGPNYIGIMFSDDGTGVRTAIEERIFDLFFTDYQKEEEIMKGSGLGLTLIKEIAEGYGGNVELLPNSDFNPGATFLVTFKKDEVT